MKLNNGRLFWVTRILVFAGCGLMRMSGQESIQLPQFTRDNRLMQPVNYREWVYLSSSLGMTYGALASGSGENPRFENVFVNPPAFQEFMKTGRWPNGTILVLEVRDSLDKGSIIEGGRYQGDIVGAQAAVKDATRFPEKWAYFRVSSSGAPVAALPRSAGCAACHAANAAVENSFAQFYPAIFAVAKAKGTLNPKYRDH